MLVYRISLLRAENTTLPPNPNSSRTVTVSSQPDMGMIHQTTPLDAQCTTCSGELEILRGLFMGELTVTKQA
jgi:hypothetical protein